MIPRIERDFLQTDLSAIEGLIAKLPSGDIVSRLGLEGRREEIRTQLSTLEATTRTLASASLFFSGAPVVSNRGIESTFGSEVINRFQDIVSKAHGARKRFVLSQRGPIPDRERSKLYVTQIVHGSFGFLFEELDDPSMFDSDLKETVDEATRVIANLDAVDDQLLASLIDALDDRVLESIKGFFSYIKGRDATFRVVSDAVDKDYDPGSIQQALMRVESTEVTEESLPAEGQLLGILPEQRTFEYRSDIRGVLSGKVAMTLPSEDLSAMNVTWVTKRSVASLRVRRVTRRGTLVREVYFLLGIDPPSSHIPDPTP